MIIKFIVFFEKLLAISLYALPVVLTFSRALTEILLGIIIVSWLMIKIAKKERINFKKELMTPVLIFWFVCALSIIASIFPLKSFEELLNITEYMILAMIVMEYFNDIRKIERISKIIIFTAFAISVDGIFQLYAGHDLFRWKPPLEIDGTPRLTASFNHPNNLGAFLSMSIPVCVSLIFFIKKWWLWILMPTVLFVIAWTFSRGAWVALILSMTLFSILKDKRLGWGIVLMIVLFIFTMPDVMVHRMKEIFNIQNVTTQTRFELWENAWGLFLQKPFLGNGLKTFSSLIEKGYVHNCYLQILVETGVMGFLSFVFVLLIFFVRTLKKSNNILQIGLGCSVLTTAIHSVGDTNLYSMPIATFFWFLLGLGLSFENTPKKQGT